MPRDERTDGASEGDGRGPASLSRRRLLAALGAGGAGTVAGCDALSSGDGTESPTDTTPPDTGTRADTGTPSTEWSGDVDAGGHALTNLGSLSTSGGDRIADFTGENLSASEGTLNANVSGTMPETVHIVTEYPGETLDQKLRAVLDELRGSQPGHRIVIPAPEEGDPAAVEGTNFWRFEEPVVIDQNTGKLVFEMGWTIMFATAPIESFFVVGPDEKTEGIVFDGGYLYARGNLGQSFIDIQGCGHMQIYRMYLQSLTGGRNSVPAGIRLADAHGSSEITVRDVEATGCTDGFLATQVADVPYGGAFDLDIYNWRAGGGEHCIRLDGGTTVQLHSIQTGGAPEQSVSESVVKLENMINPVRKCSISHVREHHNSMSYRVGVEAVDISNGAVPRHDGVYVSDVDVEHAEYSTALEHVDGYEQSHLRPAPKPVSDGDGRSQWYDERAVHDSTNGHAFQTGGTEQVVVTANGLEHAGDGSGPVVTTPDGATKYRIRVDDDGNLTTEEVGGN